MTTLKQMLGGNIRQYGIVGALFAIPFGVLTDRTARVRLLTISIVWWGVAEAVSGFSTSLCTVIMRSASSSTTTTMYGMTPSV